MTTLIIATALLATSAPSYSKGMSERSNERQEARDTRQGGREKARDVKAACKEGDEKSRETARHIRKQ